ncbi:segregation and condensation protein A [Lacimicrobium alkaliphilum]|uniref:Segregation and condensation protein A n=1 Tax=Lacimicrobium alkaliphilum TaxID=1526571 RepID=A0ABQ1R4P3_9ALTE|nr:ScpA family protein [Lacimicrobium alkaliphilum]GGD54804.1 segregation and condensation protein A [Lacimicrobium alkaliphilum]
MSEQLPPSAPPKEPVQQPLPLAFVNGQALIEKPEDLYIPPDALEVILESFEGPLDLLLYLIRKQKFDIATLPILQITRQYMEYVDLMQEVKLELAGEYLLMAAILAEIKSRVLLPRRQEADDDEEDPRAELIRRLREYEKIKQAAHELDNIPRQERELFIGTANAADNCQPSIILPKVTLQELAFSLQEVIKRASAFEHHHIRPETLSTRQRMSDILQRLREARFVSFYQLFEPKEGKAGVVVSFLAILELVKESLVDLVQTEAYGDIHVQARGDADIYQEGVSSENL